MKYSESSSPRTVCLKNYKKERNTEYMKVLAKGLCPKCGSKLKRNLSISGWWQCEQYGAVTHRARPNDPQCEYQLFLYDI